MAAKPQPMTLQGKEITLTPIQNSDAQALWAVSQDPQIWRFMPFPMTSADHMQAYVNHSVAQADSGKSVTWVTRLKETDEAIGSSSFLAIDVAHKRLEIGGTWVAPTHQRTAANTEAKYLMLKYGFERLNLNRIEFKTDSLNSKSRAALARIGATEEGTFRNHMVMPDGRIRHSVYFSIVREEWDRVKGNIEDRLHNA